MDIRQCILARSNEFSRAATMSKAELTLAVRIALLNLNINIHRNTQRALVTRIHEFLESLTPAENPSVSP